MGDQFGPQMVPMSQVVADPTTRENVLAYIAALPNNPSAVTVTGGDAEHGRTLYSTCSTCHGAEGQGRWGTNAPRLAGISDWYLERQLQYFKDGVRGSHPRRRPRGSNGDIGPDWLTRRRKRGVRNGQSQRFRDDLRRGGGTEELASSAG